MCKGQKTTIASSPYLLPYLRQLTQEFLLPASHLAVGTCWLYRCVRYCIQLHMGSENPNSGCQTCETNTLPTESAPQPKCLAFIRSSYPKVFNEFLRKNFFMRAMVSRPLNVINGL